MKKYKIIYYSSHPTHDTVSEVGYATHQRETIYALRGLGHQVIKVNMGDLRKSGNHDSSSSVPQKQGLKSILKALTPRFVWISLKDIKLLKHDKKAAQYLEQAVLEHQPDLIYERNEILQSSGAQMAKKYGIPYFLEVNAPFPEEMIRLEGLSLLHLFSNKIEKIKYRQANKIFVVSTALRTFLQKNFKVDEKIIRLAPNRITPGKFYRLENRKKLETFGFVGSILPYHKVELLIRAFGKLQESRPDTRLIIVGDGAQKEALVQLSIQMNIADKITFTGKVPNEEIIQQLDKMDVCVMPGTNWYGSPVKVFEYGAACKPIIAPNQAPLRDVMISGKHGLLSEENENSLFEALLYMVENPEKAIEMAEAFHSEVMRTYTWEKAAEEIIKEV